MNNRFFHLHNILKKYFYTIEPTNRIEIDKNILLQNYKYLIKKNSGKPVFPVIKANAYGHGTRQICEILSEERDIDYIATDSSVEYKYVMQYTSHRALIMGEAFPSSNYRIYDPRRTAFCVYNLSTLKYLAEQNNLYTVHLFVNTGMNREGISLEEISCALEIIKKSRIRLEGMCSHLYGSDEVDSSSIKNQNVVFMKALKLVEVPLKYVHLNASMGILKNQQNYLTAARSGKAMYGYNTLQGSDPYYDVAGILSPCLEVKSKIISVQKIRKGEGVGYNGIFIALEDGYIASFPFGFYEGIPQELSGKMPVEIAGKYYILSGKVSMNYASVFMKNPCNLGEKVVIFSSKKNNENSFQNAAKSIGCGYSHILTNLSNDVYRYVV